MTIREREDLENLKGNEECCCSECCVNNQCSMMTDQHIQHLNGQYSDDKHPPIHDEQKYVEEETETINDGISANERSRLCFKKIEKQGAWIIHMCKESLRWENLPVSWPIFTFLLSILLSLIHLFRQANINNWYLECNKISNRLDKRLYGWQFLHFNLKHISRNIFVFSIYGAIAESILGNVPFLLTFLGFCISMPNEWYDQKLESNNCRAEHIIGLSGVIQAFGIISVFSTFYRLIFVFIRTKCPNKNLCRNGRRHREMLACIRIACYCPGFIFSLAVVLHSLFNDVLWPSPGLANDIHILGYIQGCKSILLLLPFCILRDFCKRSKPRVKNTE